MESPVYSTANSRVFNDGGLGYAIVDKGGFASPAPGWVELGPVAAAAYLATVNADYAAGVANYQANVAIGVADDLAACLARKDSYDYLVSIAYPDAIAHSISGWDHGDC